MNWLVLFSWSLLEFRLAYGDKETSALIPRALTAAPIVVTPSESLDGIDGFWSTFTFRIGNPPQVVRLLPSTASFQTLVVRPEGCPAGWLQDCAGLRGWLFTNTSSTTWSDRGRWEISIQQNLHPPRIGQFGLDSIGIGTSGPKLDQQVIGAVASETYFLGLFALNPRAMNFTSVNDPIPSLMTNLKTNGSIPSISFGYTVGAPYKLKGVTGSLTLGGYDSSRFTPNNLSVEFAPDNTRDLLVGLQSITATNATEENLLPTGVLTYVDSTVPYIYLPLEACQRFERAFGLTWDNRTQLYLVNETLHAELVSQNSNITFKLGNQAAGGETVDIVISYQSFDLQASAPLSTSRFFPLKRADNATQYTLGRAFFQEAYLIVDWERRNFSISQCVFRDNNPQRIVPIASVDAPDPAPLPPAEGSSLSTGATVAIAVVVVVVVLALAAVALAIFLIKRKRRRAAAKDEPEPEPQREIVEVVKVVPAEDSEYRKPELDGNNGNTPRGPGNMKLDYGFGTNSTLMSQRNSVSKIDLLTPASELPSPPLPQFELAAEEVPRQEFGDTSEEIRFRTAKMRNRQKRAMGSYGSSVTETESQSGDVSGDNPAAKPPTELPATEASKDPAPASTQEPPKPTTEPAGDDVASNPRESKAAVSPGPQRSSQDPMDDGPISPYSVGDQTGFFNNTQHSYDTPFTTPPLGAGNDGFFGATMKQ